MRLYVFKRLLWIGFFVLFTYKFGIEVLKQIPNHDQITVVNKGLQETQIGTVLFVEASDGTELYYVAETPKQVEQATETFYNLRKNMSYDIEAKGVIVSNKELLAISPATSSYSSVGSERMPYKHQVGSSNLSASTFLNSFLPHVKTFAMIFFHL